jgi:hypothetical protein
MLNGIDGIVVVDCVDVIHYLYENKKLFFLKK